MTWSSTRVDGLGLGLGEKADAAQIDAQHRNFDVAGQLGGAQEGAVATEHENQLAAFGGPLVGVDDLDLDPEGTHVVGRRGAPVRGRRPRPTARAVQSRCRRALSARGGPPRWPLRGRCAPPAGWCVRQLIADPPRRPAAPPVRAARPAAEWSVRDRSRRKYSTLPDGPGSGLAVTATVCQCSVGGAAGDGEHRVGAQLRIGDDAARAHTIPCRPRIAASPWERYRRRTDAHDVSAGSTVASEMNDRSATTRSTGPPIASAVSSRTLVRSSTVTRGSLRSDQASWP